MTMRRQIAAEFRAAGLNNFPIASQVDALVRQAQRRCWMIASGISFTCLVIGFALCFTWYGVQVNVLQSTVSVWKAQYDADHVKHHAKETKPVTKAQAQTIVQKREDERKEREP
jgi:hypothetical protein